MSNEKYFNYYVETLTSTMTDAIVRNVSLQASVKIAEEDVKELHQTIEILDAEIGRLNEELNQEKGYRESSENQKIINLESTVDRLTAELNSIRSLKNECENIKHQVEHVDTFRKELLKSRKENDDLKNRYELQIKQLNEKIDYLQLTPAKRKKYDESKIQKEEDSVVNQINTLDQTKDGGTF